jgi:hypothetical protein
MFGPVPGAGSLPWSRARLVAPIYAASRMRTAVLPNILSDSFGSISGRPRVWRRRSDTLQRFRPDGVRALQALYRLSVARMRSAARSAIMIVGAFVLPRTMLGITEASTTRRPSKP